MLGAEDLGVRELWCAVIVNPKSLVYLDGTELDYARKPERGLQVQ